MFFFRKGSIVSPVCLNVQKLKLCLENLKYYCCSLFKSCPLKETNTANVCVLPCKRISGKATLHFMGQQLNSWGNVGSNCRIPNTWKLCLGKCRPKATQSRQKM